MKVIADKRRTGKTRQLMELANASGAQIVCRSESACNDIDSEATVLGLKILKPITYTQLINNALYGKAIEKVIFDDVDWFLKSVAKNHMVEAIAINNSEAAEDNELLHW